MQPGQVKNDHSSCIRYYCWNNELTDELLVGCKPSAEASASASADGSFGQMIGQIGMNMIDMSGSGVGVASKATKGKKGPKIIIPGHYQSGDKQPQETVAVFPSQHSSADTTTGYTDTSPKASSDYKPSKESNGVMITHIPSSDVQALADAASVFNGVAGYTNMELPVVKKNGAVALSSDGTASIFHDAPTIMMTGTGGAGGYGDGSVDGSSLGDGAAGADVFASSVPQSKIDLSDCVVVDEKPLCIDESGHERCYGEQWVYSLNVCKTCSCVGAGSVTCNEQSCDPYPECPQGSFVVEEKTSKCCTSYRIVKDTCDVSKCTNVPKSCGLNEISISYPVDDCCASYECQCDKTSCFKLATVACPAGSVRAVIDSDVCCSVGKCIEIPSSSTSASAGADIFGSGITALFGNAAGDLDDGSMSPFGKLSPATGDSTPTDAVASGLSDQFLPQIAEEAPMCIDKSGQDRKYGDQWYEAGKGCTLCFCINKDSVSCQSEECDIRPPEKNGMTVVEEKTGACCATYRYVPSDCDVSKCQYHPQQCSPCQRSVAYKIDDCCSTYECACDESRCVKLGNPSCPPGSMRVVVEQNVCCPTPKCVYMNGAEANSAAKAASRMSDILAGGYYKDSPDSSFGGYPKVPKSFDGVQPKDTGFADKDSKGSAPFDKSEGETFVTNYVAGKTNIGGTSAADASGAYGMPFAGFGPQFAGYPFGSGASALGGSSIDSGKPSLLIDSSQPKFSPSTGSSYMPGSSDFIGTTTSAGSAFDDTFSGVAKDFEICAEAAICTDKSGAERCYGEQWTSACQLCTCAGVGTIQCKAEACDDVPTVPEGNKLVTEPSFDGCCNSYRVVPKECDTSTCQFEVPSCKQCESVVAYSLDKCCATYECRCNKNMCAQLQHVPCPTGFERIVTEPEACCPVGKCVSSAAASAYTSAKRNGPYVHLNTNAQGGPVGGLPYAGHTEHPSSSGMTDASNVASTYLHALSGDKSSECTEPLCMDETGRSRCYGETWYKHGDACHMCACTNRNTIECNKKECEAYPSVPAGHKVVEEKADDCCYSYKIVSEDCDITKCAENAPVCSACEDLVRYSVDKCCSTYECTCNPSKCFKLGDVPCPNGQERVTSDTQGCCAIGKCVRTVAVSASGSSVFGNGIIADVLGYSSGPNDLFSSISTSGKAKSSAEGFGSSVNEKTFEIISEAAICEDSTGKERCYGETWEVGCKVCTCAQADLVT